MKKEESFEKWIKKQQRRAKRRRWKRFPKNRLRKEVIKQKEEFEKAHGSFCGQELKITIMKFYNENPQIPENFKNWIYDNYQLLKSGLREYYELRYYFKMEIIEKVLSIREFVPQTEDAIQDIKKDYILECCRWSDIIEKNPLYKLKDILESSQEIDLEEIYRKSIQEFPEIEEYTQHKVLDY